MEGERGNHFLSQAPTIHLDRNICTDSSPMNTSQFTHFRQVLMFPNITCYLYICRQKVQRIHWRSVHCFLILLSYRSECNLFRFLREIVARLEVFTSSRVTRKKKQHKSNTRLIMISISHNLICYETCSCFINYDAFLAYPPCTTDSSREPTTNICMEENLILKYK